MMLLKRRWKNEDHLFIIVIFFLNNSFCFLWLIDNYRCFNGRYTVHPVFFNLTIKKDSLLN